MCQVQTIECPKVLVTNYFSYNLTAIKLQQDFDAIF